MSEKSVQTGPNPPENRPKMRARTMSAAFLAILLIAYLIAVTAGLIPAEQKLGTADLMLAVIVLATMTVLLDPKILERIESVNFGNLRIQLRELQEDVNDIRFIINMLVTEPEKLHLEMLDEGNTSNYSPGRGLEQELRRLRDLRCIEMKPGQHLADIPKVGIFDLSHFVTLTDLGREYLSRRKHLGRPPRSRNGAA